MNYVKITVIVLITAMVLSLALTYASIMTIIQTSEDNTERVLTSLYVDSFLCPFNSLHSFYTTSR